MAGSEAKPAAVVVAGTQATRVRFTPLCGVHSCDPACYLLEIDRARILLDCGWDDKFTPALLGPLRDALDAGPIDAVLLSHSDTAHLGALPYAFGKLGLSAPVYATIPVHKMGQMFMYDHYLSRQAFEDFDVFDLDDVDLAFSAVRTLRYSQQAVLTGRAAGVTIVPHAAGHTLGGTVWRIAKDAEEIIYAVDYNHRREKHLNGTTLDELRRPTLLITGARAASPDGGKMRTGGGGGGGGNASGAIVEQVLQCVRKDGNALVLSDTAGRMLELIMTFESAWRDQRLGNYSLVLLTSVAYNTMEFAKSQLEWMSDDITRRFDSSRHNPFATQHLRLCHSLAELRALPPVPTVVLTSPASLESGYARQLFAEWSADPRSLVLFTSRPEEGTFGAEVLQRARRAHVASRHALRMSLSERKELEGAELVEYEKARAEAAAAAAEEGPEGDESRPETEGAAPAPQEDAPPVTLVRTGEGNLTRLAALEARERRETAGEDAPLVVVRAHGSMFGGVIAHETYRQGGVLFEGIAPTEGGEPMFSHEPLLADADEYGEPVDWDENRETHMAVPAPQAGGEDVVMDDDAGGADANAGPSASGVGVEEPDMDFERAFSGGAQQDAPQARAAKPTKVERRTVSLDPRCSVRQVAFEGLSDLRSLKTILSHVAPFNVIVVRGTPAETRALTAHCLSIAAEKDTVHAPHVMQTVDTTSQTAMYRIELTDALMRDTRFTRVGGCDVARVDGIVHGADAAVAEAEEEAAAATNAAADAAAEAARAQAPFMLGPMESERDHPAVFLGELRLGDFKQSLEKSGVATEFDAGTLKCGPLVRVAKQNPQHVVFEGALSEEYYKLRQQCYGEFVQL